MGETTFLGTAWFIITSIVAALMWAAQIGPKAAASNLSDWGAWIGLSPPNWLRSSQADLAVRYGGPCLLSMLAAIGVWIFWSQEAAVYVACTELIVFALFSLWRRSKVVGIALTILSFVTLGVGLSLVMFGKTETTRVTDSRSTDFSIGNPLWGSSEALLNKRGKVGHFIHGERTPTTFNIGGDPPYITYWGEALGPWPTIADGFTEYQLRKEPSRLRQNPFDWGNSFGAGPNANGDMKISSIAKVSRNESDEEAILDDAYLVSGITGTRRNMIIRVGQQSASIADIEPIAPGANVVLIADFNEAAGGLSEAEFMSEWARTYFVYAFNGKAPVRELMDESFFKSLFDGLRPRRNVEPRVTLKKK